MFERFSFSKKQIDAYLQSALRDFYIASVSDIPEVSFRFCYDTLLKLSIAICAVNGLRVKSRQGHHIELIKKLSSFLNDPEIEIMVNEMRAKAIRILKKNRAAEKAHLAIMEKKKLSVRLTSNWKNCAKRWKKEKKN